MRVGECSAQFSLWVVSGLVSSGVVFVVFVWFLRFRGFHGLFFCSRFVHGGFEFLGTWLGFTHATIVPVYHFFLFNFTLFPPLFLYGFMVACWRCHSFRGAVYYYRQKVNYNLPRVLGRHFF